MALAVGMSAGLECAQDVLAVGRTDVTDVIVNTAGAMVGIGVVSLAHLGLGRRTLRVMPRACAVGTVGALAACAMFVAGPIPTDHRTSGATVRARAAWAATTPADRTSESPRVRGPGARRNTRGALPSHCG